MLARIEFAVESVKDLCAWELLQKSLDLPAPKGPSPIPPLHWQCQLLCCLQELWEEQEHFCFGGPELISHLIPISMIPQSEMDMNFLFISHTGKKKMDQAGYSVLIKEKVEFQF